MKKLFAPIFICLFALSVGFLNTSCDDVNKLLSNDETAAGLREALSIGTDTSVAQSGVVDGFFGNALIKVLLPDEMQEIVNRTQNIPFVNSTVNQGLDQLVLKMNRAAEAAAPQAKDIFKGTISNITFGDALGILQGGDRAATNFLDNNARPELYNAFLPKVETVTSQVGADAAFNTVTGFWNQYVGPFTGTNLTTDLNDYVTTKAMDGLFELIAQEEKKIREDPLHRVTSLLQRVFGQ